MRKLLLRFCCDDAGVSAVEFAMVAALILVPLMLGVSELGYRAWAKHQFEDAAHQGFGRRLGRKIFICNVKLHRGAEETLQ